MEDDWVTLRTVDTSEEVPLIAGLWKGAGIRCEVESLLSRQEPVSLGRFGRAHLWVPVAERDGACQRPAGLDVAAEPGSRLEETKVKADPRGASAPPRP